MKFVSSAEVMQRLSLCYHVVTSLSEDAFQDYGRRMLEHFKRFWPSTVSLSVYPWADLSQKSIGWIREQGFFVTPLPDWHWEFQHRHKDNPAANGLKGDRYDYRHDCSKWLCKVAAVTDAFWRLRKEDDDDHVLIWLDADTLTKAEVTEEWLDGLLGDNFMAWLDREGKCQEGSCLMFRVDNPLCVVLLDHWRHVYLTDEVFAYPYTADNEVMQLLVNQMGVKPQSLSGDGRYNLEPFNEGPLSERMLHYKGPVAKARATPPISEDYRALQAELHASRPDYGAQGRRFARSIEDIALEFGCTSLLDYGSGKGTLREALAESSCTQLARIDEYDPAIPGKDGEPQPADLVACTDVLEHVEQAKISVVLDHIRRLTQKVALLVISTQCSTKTLADGRNAHILSREPDWWADALSRFFTFRRFDVLPEEIRLIVSPKLYEPNIVTFAALGEEQRLRHARENIKRVTRRLEEHEPHQRKAIIVCYGPSLKYTWQQIPHDMGDQMSKRRTVFSVSGAHQFLVDRGIPPSIHIDCDPREHKAKQFGEPNYGVSYWLASCVHPAYLDKLNIPAIGAKVSSIIIPSKESHRVSLWHLWNGEESSALLNDLEPGEWMVQGGGSVGLRAMMLLYCMGYRDFEIHGMDCSYAAGEKYAGAHFGKAHHDLRIKCGDRWFDTGASMVAYAQQFFITRQAMKDAEIRLHGDGLLQHMVRIQHTLTG